MGIKGTVRRSTDGDFIHANVDIDLIIEEDKPADEKAVEIFHIIEHFCLGRRRLHIFGRDSTIRPGWVTVGPTLTSSNYDSEIYNGLFSSQDEFLTGCSEEIERLRPKSPPPKIKGGPNQGGQKDGGRGGGPPRGRGMARGGPSPRGALVPRGGGNTRGMPPRQGLMPRGGWGGQGGYGGRGRGGGHRGMPPR